MGRRWAQEGRAERTARSRAKCPRPAQPWWRVGAGPGPRGGPRAAHCIGSAATRQGPAALCLALLIALPRNIAPEPRRSQRDIRE